MKLPIIAIICAIPLAASSATLSPYTPGGAPCAGACTQPWAMAQFAAPDGVAIPMTIPRGSRVLQMSYGRDGQPYTLHEFGAYLAEDEPGIGYPFEDADGRILWLVRIDACLNWAVVDISQAASLQIDNPVTSPVTLASFSPVIASYSPVSFSTTSYGSISGGSSIIIGGVSEGDSGSGGTIPDAPSPVPLPASAWLLLAAMAGLWRAAQ